MASILRQIVASPRARHPEANLDLCYVTKYIIATSGPSSTYPQRAYRNPTDELVKFLDEKHGDAWAIWEFRAEGTGYNDDEVHGRIHHFPWPDHHPPPFALIPSIMAGMRDWIKGPGSEGKGRVAVVHCKAGKGRSGTVTTSYMISEEGWSRKDAMDRFTSRRMRPGFGSGVSIPSQVRWVGYVDWWTQHGKIYVEREIEIVEVHVWGLKSGVKVSVEGYVDKGRKIKTFHTFSKHERLIVDRDNAADTPSDANLGTEPKPAVTGDSLDSSTSVATTRPTMKPSNNSSDLTDATVLFKPHSPLILPTSDVNIDFERRNKANYGFTMVTSVAHVWFNCYFEAFQHHVNHTLDASTSLETSEADNQVHPEAPATSGAFSIAWEGMDGIKGSARKGIRAFDKLSVVWRVASSSGNEALTSSNKNPEGQVIEQPKPGTAIEEPGAASSPSLLSHLKPSSMPVGKHKTTGLRTESPTGTTCISRAESLQEDKESGEKADKAVVEGAIADDDSEVGVQAHGPDGAEEAPGKGT